MEGEPPIVVAIKGLRYTGKTTVASRIAELLKCPLISVDDILDDLSELQVGVLDVSTQPDPEVAESLFNCGYAMACRLGNTQVHMGQSVIIDSPLSNFSRLRPLFSSVYSNWGDAFVIVECKPTSNNWYANFRERNKRHDRWYKPRSWDDAKSAKDENDCPTGVPRLIVETFEYVDYDKVVKALADIAYCSMGHVVELDSWKPFHYNETNGEQHVICDRKRLFAMSKEMGEQPYSNATHALTEFKQVEDGAYCWACQRPASGTAYTCRCGCRVVLHELCQKLSENKAHAKTPKSRIELLRQRLLGGYTFPNPRRCKRCRAIQQEFSYECQTCLFETHLRCEYTSTIIPKFKMHEHMLVLQARSIPHGNSYRCQACGKHGSYAGYSCFCCNKHYHVGCVLMPLSLAHEHGGWKHQMDLKFKSAEDEEGTFCDFCYRDLDPNYWFYECKEGCYLTHIECVFSELYDDERQVHIIGNDPPEVLEKKYEHFCNGNHVITYSDKYEPPKGKSDGVPSCWACEKPISGAVYICKRCSLALHDSCAEFARSVNIGEPPLNLLETVEVGYSFSEPTLWDTHPEIHRCSLCAGSGRFISYECGKCIFEANLKHKKWPPILHHSGHQHHISFWAVPLAPVGRFQCYLCREAGSFFSYDCMTCKNFRFHIHCTLNYLR